MADHRCELGRRLFSQSD